VTRTRIGPALGAGLVVTLAALLVFTGVGPPFYHANDDAVMNCIADGLGWIGGEVHPSERVVFLHVALGRLLVALYRRRPTVPWYGLMLLSSVALASFSVVYAGLRLRLRRLHAAVVLAFGALIVFLGLTTLHFGVTASLLAGSAVVLACSLGMRRPSSAASTGLLTALVLGEALLAGMLRPEGCYLGLAAASPLAWMVFRRRGRRELRAAVSGLALFGTLHAALLVYEVRDYRAAPGWADTFAWMRAETPFIAHGWVSYDAKSKPAFDQAGWTVNDFEMLRRYFSWDPELYSSASLRRLTALLQEAGAVSRFNPAREGLRKALLNPLSGAALVLTLLCCLPGSRREAVELTLGFLCAGALIYAVGFALRAPPLRVYMPVWLVSMAVPVFWACVREHDGTGAERQDAPRAAPVAVLCSLAVLVLLGAWQFRVAKADMEFRTNRALAAQRDLERLSPFRADLLVNWGGVFPVQDLVRPFDTGGARAAEDAHYGAFSFFWIGWPTRLPINQAWLQRRGVGDLYEALYRRDDVLLLALPENLVFIERFILEHRGVSVGHRLVLAGETVSVFRVFESGPPARD
jgi:hypothetical protein